MRAKLGGTRYGEGEIAVVIGAGLHEQDLAVWTHGANHVQVECLLAGPTCIIDGIA